MTHIPDTTEPDPVAAAALRRRRALDAMGIRLLTARRPLPGAATASHYIIRPAAPADVPPPQAVRPPSPPPAPTAAAAVTRAIEPGPELTASAAPTVAAAPPKTAALRCRVVMTLAGECLWLEVMAPGQLPDPRCQLLLRNVVAALQLPGETDEVEFFDWPMTDSPQLDHSAAAAAAALAGLLARRSEQRRLRAVVVLGDSAGQWLDASLPRTLPMLQAPALSAALTSADLKRALWRALAALHSR